MSASLMPVAAARLVLPTPPLPLNNKILIHSLYANGMPRFTWSKTSEKTRLGSTLTAAEVRIRHHRTREKPVDGRSQRPLRQKRRRHQGRIRHIGQVDAAGPLCLFYLHYRSTNGRRSRPVAEALGSRFTDLAECGRIGRAIRRHCPSRSACVGNDSSVTSRRRGGEF
jgi:hypothetical protein